MRFIGCVLIIVPCGPSDDAHGEQHGCGSGPEHAPSEEACRGGARRLAIRRLFDSGQNAVAQIGGRGHERQALDAMDRPLQRLPVC